MDYKKAFDPLSKFFNQYNRNTKLVISFSILGLIFFLTVTAAAPFKDQLFSKLYPKSKSQAQEVSVASGLTTQLIASRDRFNTASGVPLQESTISAQTSELTTMIDIASQRKTALLNELKQDPNLFLKDATLADQRSSFPQEVQGYIEEKTTVEGSSAVIILDNFNEKKSLTEYSVIIINNRKIILHPANQLPTPLVSGMTVKVNGLRLDNELAFDASQPNNLTVLQSPSVIPDSLGEQKVAVILANFQNTQQPNLTGEWFNNVIFNNINSYYQEASYRKTSLSGRVFGWYTLPINQSCDDYWNVFNSALLAAAGDIDYTKYRGVIIIAPFGGGCFWAGLGIVGKANLTTPNGQVNISVSWVNSSILPVDNLYYFGIISGITAHEFGHNLGLMHARFINCGSVPIAASGCIISEYGDHMDVMGLLSITQGHFNAPHKDYLGWFAPSNVLTVPRSGIYILEPYETSSAGLKVLKIPRESGYLYIEYRQPIGFDIGFTDYQYTGAWIHTAESSASDLYDMSVPPAESVTARMLIGETYQDPETDTVITVKSRTDSALTIEVNIPRCTSDAQCGIGQVCSGGSCVLAPTPTPSTGNCQCDLGYVVSNNCNLPNVAACSGKFSCVCILPTPTPTPSCPLVVCDVNGDGKEDYQDGSIVRNCWLQPATGVCQKVDAQCDGTINIIDIQKFAYQCPQIFKLDINTSIQIQDKIQL